MAARRYELTDTQWDRIKDLIPRAKTGRPPKDDRMMLNACLLYTSPCRLQRNKAVLALAHHVAAGSLAGHAAALNAVSYTHLVWLMP